MIYNTSKLSVIDIEIFQSFDDIVSIDIQDETISPDKVKYKMSWGFDDNENQTFSAYMLIGEAISHIQRLQVVKDSPVCIKLQIEVDTVDDYTLNAIEVNDTLLENDVIAVVDNSNYRYGMTIPLSKNIYQPYDNMEAAIELRNMLTYGADMVITHPFVYFKVEETDVNHTFKTITDLTLEAVKYVRCAIPENDFKSDKIVYTDWGAAYEDEFELHITLDQFQQKFGSNAKPSALDYFVIPKLNRIYEVTSAYEPDNLLHTGVYYVLTAKKYKFRSNRDTAQKLADKEVFDIDTIREFNIDGRQDINNPDTVSPVSDDDSLTDSDALAESINASGEHALMDMRMHDHMRDFIHNSIVHNRYALCTGSIKYSTAQYNLNDTGNPNNDSDIAVLYKNKFTDVDTLRSGQLWFNWTRLASGGLFKMDKIGCYVEYDSDNNILSLVVKYDPYDTVMHKVEISSSKWYNMAININHETKTSAFEITENGNTSGFGSPKLATPIKLSFPFDDSIVNEFGDGRIALLSGYSFITNIRVYNKLTDSKQIITNAVIPKANTDNSIVIDNCGAWEAPKI